MARRIDVTGAGGVRLAAWEFGDPPKTDQTADQPADREADQAANPATGQATAPAGAPGVLLLHGLMGRASHWAATAR
ncbi:alpha/beta hydrolase, partial [Streptomyces sp. TRM76130]|nr:alpha/beta hydrolase [Streptomyces sp. TRM76130]